LKTKTAVKIKQKSNSEILKNTIVESIEDKKGEGLLKLKKT